MKSESKSQMTDETEDAMFNTRPHELISGRKAIASIAFGIAIIFSIVIGIYLILK